MFGSSYFGGTVSGGNSAGSTGTATLTDDDRARLDSIPLPPTGFTGVNFYTIPETDLVYDDINTNIDAKQDVLSSDDVRRIESVPVPPAGVNGPNLYTIQQTDTMLTYYRQNVASTLDVTSDTTIGTFVSDPVFLRRRFITLNPTIDNARVTIPSPSSTGLPRILPGTVWVRTSPTSMWASSDDDWKTVRLINLSNIYSICLNLHTQWEMTQMTYTMDPQWQSIMYATVPDRVLNLAERNVLETGTAQALTYAEVRYPGSNTVALPAIEVPQYIIYPNEYLDVTYIGNDTFLLENLRGIWNEVDKVSNNTIQSLATMYTQSEVDAKLNNLVGKPVVRRDGAQVASQATDLDAVVLLGTGATADVTYSIQSNHWGTDVDDPNYWRPLELLNASDEYNVEIDFQIGTLQSYANYTTIRRRGTAVIKRLDATNWILVGSLI